MYKGPKVSLRSLSLSKGLRLKIAIAGVVVTVVTVASVLTGISLAQTTAPSGSISFAEPPPIPEFVFNGVDTTPDFLRVYHTVVNDGDKSFNSIVPVAADLAEGTTVSVRVEVFGDAPPAGSVVNLLLSTEDGTAVSGVDYLPIPELDRRITLSRGMTAVDVEIRILTTDNDNVLQSDKTFDLVLEVQPGTTLPDGFTLDPDGARTEIVIKDNETALSFTEISYEIEEGAGDQDLEVTVVAYPSGGLKGLTGGAATTAVVETVAGTATEIHYQRRAGFDIALFFDNAGRRESFDIRIFGDDVLDPPRFKEFYLELKNDPFTTPPAAVGVNPINPDRNRVTITIEDDDQPEFGFDGAPYDVGVDDGNVTIIPGILYDTDVLTNDVITLLISTEDGSAIAGTDYVPVSNLEVQVSRRMRTVEVPIEILETARDGRVFNVVLRVKPGTTLPDEFAPFPPDGLIRATVGIGSNLIGFQDVPAGGYVIGEGVRSLDVTFGADRSTGLPEDGLTLKLVSRDGSARVGTHFSVPTSAVLRVRDISLNERATINIFDNEIADGPSVKEFYLELALSDPDATLPEGVEFHPTNRRVRVQIEDNDPINWIGFEETTYRVKEGELLNAAGEMTNDKGAGVLEIAFRTSEGAPYMSTLVFFNTMDGGAVSGADFDGVSNQQVSFGLNDEAKTVKVNILDDAVSEGPGGTDDGPSRFENFFVELSERGGLPDGIEIDPNRRRAEIIIEDDDLVDDEVRVGFTAASYGALENVGQHVVGVELKNGTLDEEITLIASTVDGTARSPGDYVLTTEKITFSSSVTQTAIVIPINLDRLAEGDERFEVVLQEDPNNPLPDGVELDPAFSRAEFVISDEIILTVGFVGLNSGNVEVAEDAGTAELRFRLLSEGVALVDDKPIYIDYFTSHDSAGSQDYESKAGTIILPSALSVGVIEIPIKDDLRNEGDETILVTLAKSDQSVPNSPEIQLNPRQARVTIKDNDPLPADTTVIRFQESGISIDEGSSATPAFEAIGATPDELETTLNNLILTTAAGTAVGSDYQLSGSTVELTLVRAGVPPAPFIRKVGTSGKIPAITAQNDTLFEEPQTFLVYLRAAPGTSLPNGVQLSQDPLEVTIISDDQATIGFQETTHRVDEGGTAKVTIAVLTGVLAGGEEVELDYTINSGSATAGSDYRALATGKVTLNSGKTEETISIDIIDDDEIYELDEERFTISLSTSHQAAQSPTRATLSVAPDETEILIINNDLRPPVTIEFENLSTPNGRDSTLQPIPDGPIYENWSGPAARFEVSIPEPVSVPLAITVGLDSPAISDSSLIFPDSGRFPSANRAVVNIPAGETSGRFTVGVEDDVIAEYDEEWTVGLLGIEATLSIGTSATVLRYGPDPEDSTIDLTVRSDDPLFLNLESTRSIKESTSTVYVSGEAAIALSNPYQLLGRHDLFLSITDQFGKVPSDVSIMIIATGVSYSAERAILPLIDGDKQAMFEIIHATNNDVYQGNLIYSINVFGDEDLPDFVTFGDASSQYVFEDVDQPVFKLDFGGVTSIEEGESIDVELELTNGPTDGLLVGLDRIALGSDLTLDGDLAGDGDLAIYGGVGVPSDLFVSIPAGTNKVTFPLRARYDHFYDPKEQFRLLVKSVATGVEFEESNSDLNIVHTQVGLITPSVIRIMETQAIRSEITVTPERVLEGQSVDIEITLDRYLGASDIAKFERENHLDSSNMMFTETAIIVTVPLDIFAPDLTLDHNLIQDQFTYLIPLDEFTQTMVARGESSKFTFKLNILSNNTPEPIEVTELLFEFPDLIDTSPEKAHEGFERSEVPLAFAIIDPNPLVEVDLDVKLDNVFAVEGGEAVLVLTLSEPLDYRLEEPYLPTFAASPATDLSDFEDISEIGTKIAELSTSSEKSVQSTRQLNLGVTTADTFNFEFYGVNYDQIVVSSNGFLVPTRVDNLIAADQDTTNNVDLAVATDRPRYLEQIIAPFWAELHGPAPTSDSGGVYEAVLGEAPYRRYIVQWQNIQVTPGDGEARWLRFQAVLFESSNDIEFRYDQVGTEHRDKATIGIADGDRYLQDSYKGTRLTPTPAGAAGNDAGTVPDRPQVVRENWKIAFRASAGDSLDGSVRVDVEPRYRPDFGVNFPRIIPLSEFVGTRYELPVPIRADGLVETNENVRFTLQNLPNGYRLPAGGGSAELEIRDSGELSVAIDIGDGSSRTLSAVEGESTELVLTLSEPLSADILYGYSDYVKHIEHYSAEEFEFIFDDISERGTFVEGFGGVGQESRNRDDRWITRRPGFEFDLYDKSYNQLAININGLLAFAPPGANGGPTDLRAQHDFFDTANNQIPIGTSFLGTEPPFSVASELSTRLYESPLIAGLWADYDLDTDGTSGRIYELTEGEPGNRRYIVQWDKVFVKDTDFLPGQAGYNPDGSVTFQVILHEGSNNIEFVYPDTTGTFARTSNGYGASVGLNDGLIGGQSLEVSYEAPSVTDPSGPGPIPDYTRVLLTREPIVRVTADRPEDLSPGFPLEFSLRDFATSTASQERIEVELEILFDGLVEASEDVRLELELIGLPPGSNFGILADNGDATLTIEGDGRAPALELAFEPSVGVEGGNASLVLTLSEPLNYLRETLFEATVQASDFVFNNEEDTLEPSRLDAQSDFKREVNDLIQTTVPLNLDTDGTEGAEPFSFNFYGEFYDQFTVGSNGFLTLSKSDGPAAILDAPASNLSIADLNSVSVRDLISGAAGLERVPLIAPWWGGLGNSVAYLEQAKIEGEYPQRTLIVQWQSYVDGTEDELVQFQARLHENSAVIEFDYFETDLTLATTRSDGAGATIGIFNIGADPTLQQYVAVDGNGRGNEGLLTENSTIVFTPSPIYLSDATIEIDVEDPFQRMDFTVDFPLSVSLSEFVDGLRHTIDIPVARDTMSEGTEEVSFLVTELPLGLRSGAENGRTNFIIDPDNIRVDLEVVQERVFEGGTVDLILTLSEPLNFDPAQSEYQSEITEYTADQFAEIFEDISQNPAVRSYGLTDITSFFDLGDEDLDRGFTAEVDLGLGADGFNFYNHEFQSGYIGVNGLLALSIGEDQRLDLYDQFDASGDLSADSTRAYNDLLIAPFWTDLDLSQNSIAIAERMSAAGERVTLPRVAGGVYSLTRGEGADRRFIVQWDDVFLKDGYNSADPSSDDQALTFQLVLYEQTGDIEFRYLNVNNDASGVSSIGLNDGILGDRGVQLGNVDQSRIVNNSVVRFERVRSLFLNSDNAADFEDALPLEIPLTSFESENGTPRAEISLGILTDGKAEPQELVELQLGLASGLPLAFGDSGGSDSFIIEARQQVEVDVAVNPRRVLEGQTATVELTLSIPLPEIDVPDYQPSQRTNGNRDFTSIRADGGAAILTNQVGQTSVNLPFEFDFYDKKYSSVNVAYGFLYFGPSDSNLITIANVDYDNLGGRTLPPIIAPHWDAYDGTRSSSAVYTKTEGEEGNRRYIVEWNSASINSTDRVTFQVILHEATNDIEFIYWFNLDGHGSYSENLYGNSATVAIADTNGDEYDQIVFNRQLVRPGTRIMFNRANPSIRIDTDEQNYADLGPAFPINVPLEDFGGTLVHTIDIPVLADDITEALELVDLRLTLPEISLADHELRLGANEGRASFVIDAPDRTVDVDIAVPPGRGSVDDTATLELTLSEPTDYVWRVFSDDSNFLDLRTLPEALPANLVTASITELIDTDLKFAIPGVAPSTLVSLLGDGGNSNRAQTFTFTFYGEDYSQIWINREGFLTLGGSRLYNGPDDARLSVLGDAISRNPDYNPVPGDDRALPPVIAPWWDDFAGFSDSGEFWLVHYGIIGEYPNRQLIVQWSDARPQTSSAVSAIVRAEPITFQAVLYEGTNEIEFRYLDATTDSFTPDLDGGGAATIAIADSNARGGYVQVGYNQSVVTDNSRIRFIPGVIEVDVAENQRDNFAAEFPISVPLHEFRGDTRYTIELPRTAAQPSPSVRFTLSDLSAGLQIGAGGDNFDYLIAEPIAVSLSVPNSGRVVEGEPIELYIELSEPINFNTPLSNYVARTNSYSTEQFARVFEDISQTGTPIAQLLESSPGQADLNDGWATRLFESGFQFDFYGREYDRLFVNPDGLLTFSAPGAGGTRDYGLGSSNNSGLSNVNYRDPLIAPLWNNVNLAHQGVRTGQIYEQTLGVTPNRRYILQWDGVYLADQYNADDPGVALTYQVVLYEDGGDIEFRYLDLSTGNVMTNDGGGATIGLNDGILGDRSVEVAYNSSGTVTLASGATLGDNTRIRLSRQPSLIINTADDSEFGDTFPIYLSLEDFDLENGTRQAFIVTTAVDRLFEPQPETVPLQVELPSESLFVLSGDSGTGNLLIEDRTLPQFEVRALDANGNVVTSVREYGDENEIEVTAVDAEGNIVTSIEDNGEITVEARLLNGQGGVTTRRISFNPPVPSGIGIEAGNDYQFDDTLTIEAGQSIGMATLRIVNDKVFELTEQLLLEFSMNLVELGYGTEETYQIEISVADNDVPRYDVEFTAPPNYDFARITTGGVKYIIVEEQARDITVRFAPENAAANTTDIGIELTPNPIGSATRDQDYVLLPNSGILRGQTSGEQVIRFIDDSDYEADEQLIINSALIGGQRVTFDPIIVTIRNSVDRVGLTLNSPELINEGQDLEVEIIADQFYYPASYSYSLESGTVEHFDDIVEDKNRFNIASDSSDFASIGFTFTYYGEVYDQLLVNTNGFVALRDSSQSTTELVGRLSSDNGNLELGREGTPSGRGAPIIAPYWDDLDVLDGDLVGGVYQRQFADRYVVQWNKVIFAGGSALDAVTFQLVLHKDSNQIEFRYLDVTTTETDSNGNGAQATVGLSSGGFDATQLSFDTAGIYDGLRVIFDTEPVEDIQLDIRNESDETIDFENQDPIDLIELWRNTLIGDTPRAVYTSVRDSITEGDHEYSLNFRGVASDVPGGSIFVLGPEATTTVRDDDVVSLTFREEEYVVRAGEQTGPNDILLQINPVLPFDTSVRINGRLVSDTRGDFSVRGLSPYGTITATADYTLNPVIVEGYLDVFSNAAQVTASIELTAELVGEGLLSRSNSTILNIVGAPSNEPRFTLGSNGRLVESAGSEAYIELVVDNAPAEGVYETLTVVLSANYSGALTIVSTIPVGKRSVRVPLPIDDDSEVEEDQNFLLEITSYGIGSTPVVTYPEASRPSFNLYIDDDDAQRDLNFPFVASNSRLVPGEFIELNLNVELSAPLPDIYEDDYAVRELDYSLFEDISDSGKRFLLNSTNSFLLENFGSDFEFEFYGQPYSEVGISPNGFLSFDPDYLGENSAVNGDLRIGQAGTPAGLGLPTIAAFWNELDISAADADIYVKQTGQAPNRRYIVQWDDAKIVATDVVVTFQIVLHEGSGAIEFRYDNLPDGAEDAATIGISGGGLYYLSASYNGDLGSAQSLIFDPLYRALRVPSPSDDIRPTDLVPLLRGGPIIGLPVTFGLSSDQSVDALEFEPLRLVEVADSDFSSTSTINFLIQPDWELSLETLSADRVVEGDRFTLTVELDQPLGPNRDQLFGTGYRVFSGTVGLTGGSIVGRGGQPLSFADGTDRAIEVSNDIGFEFFGEVAPTLYVFADGYVEFEDSNSDSDGSVISQKPTPNFLTVPIVMPYWSEVDNNSGQVYILRESNRIILEWNGFTTPGETAKLTHQLILHASSNLIEINVLESIDRAARSAISDGRTLINLDSGTLPDGTRYVLLPQTRLMVAATNNDDFIGFPIDVGQYLASAERGTTLFEIPIETAQDNDIDLAEQTQLRLLVSGGNALRLGEARTPDLELVAYQHGVLEVTTVDITAETLSVSEGSDARLKLTLAGPLLAALDNYESVIYTQDIFDFNSGGSNFELLDSNTDRLSGFNDTDDGWTTDSLPSNFNFNFYGDNYDEVYISTNGLLQFQGPNDPNPVGLSLKTNENFRETPPSNPTIAPFWDDLTTQAGQNVQIYRDVRGTSPNRRYIVQWGPVYKVQDSAPLSGDGDELYFQVVLYEDNNEIEFRYHDVETSSRDRTSFKDVTALGTNYRGSSGATTGIAAGDDLNHFQQTFYGSGDSSVSPVIIGNSRIRYVPQPAFRLELNSDNGGEFDTDFPISITSFDFSSAGEYELALPVLSDGVEEPQDLIDLRLSFNDLGIPLRFGESDGVASLIINPSSGLPNISLQPLRSSLPEGSNLLAIRVNLSRPLDSSISADTVLATIDQLSGGVEYVAADGSVGSDLFPIDILAGHFANRATRYDARVAVAANTVDDGDRESVLGLTSVNSAIVADPSQDEVTLTIQDFDVPGLGEFTLDKQYLSEGDQLRLTLELDSPPDVPADLPAYSFVSGRLGGDGFFHIAGGSPLGTPAAIYQRFPGDFGFEFYGVEYDGIWISGDGYISFSNNGERMEDNLPTAAIWRERLSYFDFGERGLYVKADGDVYIIEWRNRRINNKFISHQIRLDARDNSISFAYQNDGVEGTDSEHGRQAIIGINNGAGNQAILINDGGTVSGDPDAYPRYVYASDGNDSVPVEIKFIPNQILIDTDQPGLFDPAISFPIVVSGADFEGGTTYSRVLPIRPAALNGALGQVATLEVISNSELGLASTTREITVVDQDADFSLTLESDVVPEGAFTPAGGTARNATFEEGDPVRLTIDLSGPLSEVLRDTARRYSVSTPEVIKETDLSISADATALNLSELEPDSTIGIELPFAFDLYGVSSNDLRIGTNGFLALGGNRSEQLGARPNTDLSNGVEGNRAVAVLWDGYRINAPGAEIYTEERGIAPYREFIVQWQNLISRQGTSNYLVSFQAILLETSNEIILKYYDLGPVLPAREGGAATIGVGDGNGEAFLVGFNEQVISEGTVLRIAPAEYLIQVDVTDPIYRDEFEDILPLDITDLAITNTSAIDASIFTVELPIEIDRLLEETETVDLVVRLGHGPERDPVEIEHIATTRLTIPNTDFILMNFEQDLYEVDEGKAVQVRLSLTPTAAER